MAFAPSASWNSRSITHLANYPSPSLPMIFSDESKIKARISLLTGLRPPLDLALESHFQYSRNPERCQPTTVLGVTRMRGSFHLSQSLRNTTQNSLCDAGSRRRGRWA